MSTEIQTFGQPKLHRNVYGIEIYAQSFEYDCKLLYAKRDLYFSPERETDCLTYAIRYCIYGGFDCDIETTREIKGYHSKKGCSPWIEIAEAEMKLEERERRRVIADLGIAATKNVANLANKRFPTSNFDAYVEQCICWFEDYVNEEKLAMEFLYPIEADRPKYMTSEDHDEEIREWIRAGNRISR